MKRNMFVIVAVLIGAAGFVVPAEIGDDHPALANYSINDVAPNYHGPWLDINSYAGKGVVVVHWKAS
jgi:hypothetical protein